MFSFESRPINIGKGYSVTMHNIVVWLTAARLKIHLLGMLPVFVGCLIAYHETNEFRVPHFVLAELIALFVLITTALANDYADAEADRLNRNFGAFSGGSRVIPHGLITRYHMGIAAIISGSVALGFSLMFVFFLNGSSLFLSIMSRVLFAVAFSARSHLAKTSERP